MKETTTLPVVLSADAIAALPAVPLDNIDGVTNTVLWEDRGSLAGVLVLAGGHRLGLHAHRLNHHHLWVLDGQATVLNTVLGPGSYAHVPAGVEHDIDATGSAGCRVFYLYAPPAAGRAA